MSGIRRVAANFASLGLGEVGARLVAFATLTYLARVLGPEGFGIYTLAVQILLYLGRVADFGIEYVGSRKVARADRADVPALTAAILLSRLVLAVALILVAGIACYVWLHDPSRTVFEVILLSLLPIALNPRFVHTGLERAAPVGIGKALGEVAAFALVVTAVRGLEELPAAAASRVVAEGLMTVYLLWRLRGVGGLAFSRARWALARPVFRAAFPLLVQIMMGLLLYNADAVMLGLMRGPEVVGYYGTAYTLISFLINLSMVYATALLPGLTVAHLEDPARAGEMYQTATVHLFTFSLPAAVGAYLLADGIIDMFFGDAYAPSAAILGVLAAAVLIASVRNAPWAGLISREKQVPLGIATGVAAAANIALNLWLIPRYAAVGAAVATVTTEIPLAAASFLMARQVGLPIASPLRLLRPTIAAAVMAAAVVAASRATPSPIALVAVGVVAFAAMIVLLGGLRRGEDGRFGLRL